MLAVVDETVWNDVNRNFWYDQSVIVGVLALLGELLRNGCASCFHSYLAVRLG